MKTKNKAILVLSVLMLVYSFTLTGCGNDNVNSATDNNNQAQNGTNQNGTENNGNNNGNNNGSNVGNDLSNAVDDVGDAVGDMLGANFNGFSSYEDAHDYFMSTMQGQNNSGRYEVRNENKELNQYQNGRYGYQFELYDVTQGEGSRLGEYWVDRDTGKIYRKNDKSGDFEEYTGNTTNTQNNGNNNGNNIGNSKR